MIKLRIRGASVRLRLEQQDVERLNTEGRVTERLVLPTGESLTYGLVIDETVEDVGLEGRPNTLVVRVPQQIWRAWRTGDEESLTVELPLADVAKAGGGTLSVLIEQDLPCRH